MDEKILIVFWIFFISLFSYSILFKTTKSRFNHNKTIVFSLIFYIILVTCNIIYYIDKPLSHLELYSILTILTPQFAFTLLISKGNIISSISSSINIYITIYTVQIVKSAVSRHINESFIWLEIASLVLYVFIWLYVNKFFLNFHTELEKIAPNLILYLLFFSIVIYAEIIAYGYLLEITYENPSSLKLDMFGTAVLSVYFMSYAVFYQIFKYYKLNLVEKNKQLLRQKEIDYVEDRIKIREKKDRQLRILRHDFRHILITMQQYINEDNKVEAKKLIESYIEDVDSSQVKSYCKDYIIDSIIDYYVTLSEKNNIQFNIDVNDFEDVLSIPKQEMAVFISNCLENALNATNKLTENKRIDFTFLNNHGRLILQIKNTYDGQIKLDHNNRPTNPKKEHGLGTSSIELFAKKHNLMLDYHITNDLFVISVLFK